MYEPIIEKQIEQYQGWIDDAKAINGHATMARRLETEFPDQHYHTSVISGVDVTLNITDKDQLLRVLRHLRGYDYKVTSFEDEPLSQRRTYKLNKINQPQTHAYLPDFKITAHFNGGDDAFCKYVEVGTKTVEAVPAQEAREIPVLELRCGDEAVVEVV